MPQYTLPISLPPVFSEDNFFVSHCNRESHGWIMRWPDWPGSALILYGLAGSGKSHLGHIWAARAKAKTIDVVSSPEFSSGRILGRSSPDYPENGGENLLLENIDSLKDERALFHLLNLAKENNHFLLLTSAVSPQQLPFTLPDLTSRLRALPVAHIAAPDDEALAAVLRKQFSDRQLKVEDDVITYLLPRMERSFSAAAAMVEKIDAQSLAAQRNITIPFLKRVLDGTSF